MHVYRTMLYCTLTGQLLDKSLEAVKVHMTGKKYIYNKGEPREGRERTQRGRWRDGRCVWRF
jgi:hypothetical protein